MKKLFFSLFIFLFIPTLVLAKDYEITNHIIDSEIEIAGAFKVKELIIVKGTTDYISRTLNYYSFGSKWDGSSVDFNEGSIYNGQSIENVRVSAFKFNGDIDFSAFSKGIKEYFPILDIKNPSDKTYTVVNSEGKNTYNIYYPVKNETIVFYIEYIITNVIVLHKDILELNYTFKNTANYANNTMLRLLIPYQTKKESYNYWIHGPKTGKIEELVTEDNYRAGFLGQFTKLTHNINVRITLPLEQVGITVYLNKSDKNALDTIKKLETKKLNAAKNSTKILNFMKYFLIILSGLYVIGSLILLKNKMKSLNIIYLLLGLFIMTFNYLFKYNIIYIYLILLAPMIVMTINYFSKKNSNSNKK